MSISGVSSYSSITQPTAAAKVPQPVSSTVKIEGVDSNKNERTAASQLVKPTTNSAGEIIGTTVSTKA